MDYSRQGVALKQKEIKSTAKRLNSKLWVVVFRIFIIGIVACCIVGVMLVFGTFDALIDTAPTVQLTELEVSGFSSKAYYSDGETVSQLFIGEQANRIYAPIEEIPVMVRNCMIALEDERFYKHSGIDIRGIFRAGVSVMREGGLGFGGSTLTQQLLKNQVFGGGNESDYIEKIKRKVQEQYLAIELEHTLSKDQILEWYLNYVNFGNGAYGIKTAAQSYYGKNLDELTLSEAAVLAAIVISPTHRNPITYPDNNASRRKSCLDNMLDQGYCTKEEYDEALADDVYTRIATYNSEKVVERASTYSYFTDELVEQVYEDLETELGYTHEQAYKLLFFGGISIFTTQDKQVQDIVDKYYTDESNFPAFGFNSNGGSCFELTYALSVFKPDGTIKNYHFNDLKNYYSDFVDSEGLYYHEDGVKKGINTLLLSKADITEKIDAFREAMMEEGDNYTENWYLTPQPQCSFSIIEQSTGKVVALYGGRGEKKQSLSLNRATNTYRPVGSTFKVLAAFLPAIDAGGLTLASVQDDTRYFYPGSPKEVINWYSGFRGLQTIRTGISSSLNIVAVKTLEEIGAPLGFSYLEKLGFSTLDKNTDVNLTIALGSPTHGVSNVELTAAYAAIANEGVYNKPLYYTKIVDHDGNVLIEKKTESTQVMKKSSAWLVTDAMCDTVKNGTGTRLDFSKDYKMTIAGKTGTSSKNHDLWFAGFTPYYTASIWTGYDNNFNQLNKSYQQDIWRKIMCDVHASKQLEYATFEMPDTIVKATICTKCGNLAVAGLCDQAEGGDCTREEYFAKGTVPSQKCKCHIRVNICKKSKKLATDLCPSKKVKSVVLLVKDEAYEIDLDTGLVKDPPQLIETWDTPYVYHPEEVCDYHLPAGGLTEVPNDEEDDGDDTDSVPVVQEHNTKGESDTY